MLQEPKKETIIHIGSPVLLKGKILEGRKLGRRMAFTQALYKYIRCFYKLEIIYFCSIICCPSMLTDMGLCHT